MSNNERMRIAFKVKTEADEHLIRMLRENFDICMTIKIDPRTLEVEAEYIFPRFCKEIEFLNIYQYAQMFNLDMCECDECKVKKTADKAHEYLKSKERQDG